MPDYRNRLDMPQRHAGVPLIRVGLLLLINCAKLFWAVVGGRMKRDDWLLVAIAASRVGLSPVQAQKSMFLLREEAGTKIDKRKFYKFVPYDYGPFASNIYDDLDSLCRSDLVMRVPEAGRSWSRYRVTLDGLDRVIELKCEADADTVAFVEKVVTWVTSLTFRDLLRAIYTKYPDYSVNSVFSN